MKEVEKIQKHRKRQPELRITQRLRKSLRLQLMILTRFRFKVGEVIKCEPVKKAKKLLVSQIRIGDEVRQIVSGIAAYYKPEEMVGKKLL